VKTIEELRKELSKAFAHLHNAQLQIPMNPLPTPQVAAVHQTLAGERLVQTITFPTTGDTDCDLIQGVLAVVNSFGDTYGDRVALVLRYLADRFTANERAQVEDVTRNHALENLVRRQEVLEKHMIQLQQHSFFPAGYSSSNGTTGKPYPPPGYAPSIAQHSASVAQQIANTHASALGLFPQSSVSEAMSELDRIYASVIKADKCPPPVNPFTP